MSTDPVRRAAQTINEAFLAADRAFAQMDQPPAQPGGWVRFATPADAVQAARDKMDRLVAPEVVVPLTWANRWRFLRMAFRCGKAVRIRGKTYGQGSDLSGVRRNGSR